MSKGRGFTVVELVVVMVIMAILMGLGFTVVSSSQRNSRDTERQADVESIARGLETRYKQGNPKIQSPMFYVVPGGYPGIYEMRHMLGTNLTGYNPAFNPTQVVGGYGPDLLPGTTKDSFVAPGKTAAYDGFTLVCISDCASVTPGSRVASVTIDTYMYEPVDASNKICLSGPCTRFNLYWRKEVGGELQTITSKRQ